MAVAALKQRPAPALKQRPAPAPRTFHATMLVTRAEEWCVEAETAEEAEKNPRHHHPHPHHRTEEPVMKKTKTTTET